MGTSLLGGFLQSRSNSRAQKQMDRFKPEQVSTKGYDELYNKVNSADFDRPLYTAFQNSQRGAAQQNQRIYAQQGNAALASDRTAADRRSAEGSLFEGVMGNNLNRMNMLSNIQGQRSQVEQFNVSSNNQARMNALNFRAQNAQNNPFVNALSTAGGIGMNYFNTMGAEKMFDNRRMQDMQFMSQMFNPGQSMNPSNSPLNANGSAKSFVGHSFKFSGPLQLRNNARGPGINWNDRMNTFGNMNG
jgi:hypothetical protein